MTAARRRIAYSSRRISCVFSAGLPTMTVLRGMVAVENGRLRIGYNSSRFLRRKVDPEVGNKPAA